MMFDLGYGPIKGVHYKDGRPGRKGENGLQIELGVIDEMIQWRYVGYLEWMPLVSLEELRGEEGPRGYPGLRGEKGETGPKGESIETKIRIKVEDGYVRWKYEDSEYWTDLIPIKELQGAEGASGADGLDGREGEKGDKGDKGDRGEIGPRGLKGDKGDKGDPGRDGENGLDGLQGVRGEKGERGDPGKTGPKGDAGKTGPKGEKGDKPTRGVDYVIQHGRNGRDGRDGKDGVVVVGGDDTTSLTSASFTYTGDLVTRIDYDGGEYKTISYNGDDTVSTIVWYRTADTVTKTFTYDGGGKVTAVNVSIV